MNRHQAPQAFAHIISSAMIDLVQLKSELRETLVTNLPEVFKTLKKLLPQQSPKYDTLLALEARLQYLVFKLVEFSGKLNHSG